MGEKGQAPTQRHMDKNENMDAAGGAEVAPSEVVTPEQPTSVEPTPVAPAESQVEPSVTEEKQTEPAAVAAAPIEPTGFEITSVHTRHKWQWGTGATAGYVFFDDPGNELWNEYQKRLFRVDGQQVIDDKITAAVWLFEKLNPTFENLTARKGDKTIRITDENFKYLIPERYITEIINGTFLVGSGGFSVKNS